MSRIFEQYPEQTTPAETTEIPEAQKVFTQREMKILKKLTKELKKSNKRKKRVEKQHIVEGKKPELQKDVADKIDTTKPVKGERGEREKTFLGKLGDIFLKVFPSILRTVVKIAVPTVLGHIFKQKVRTA